VANLPETSHGGKFDTFSSKSVKPWSSNKLSVLNHAVCFGKEQTDGLFRQT
jgi:hypothetical protein